MYPRLLELGPLTVYTYGVLLAAAYLLGFFYLQNLILFMTPNNIPTIQEEDQEGEAYEIPEQASVERSNDSSKPIRATAVVRRAPIRSRIAPIRAASGVTKGVIASAAKRIAPSRRTAISVPAL